MKRIKQHQSMEAAWAYLLHLEEEEDQAKDGADKGNVPPELSYEEILAGAGDGSEDIPVDDQLLHLNDGAKLIIAMVGKPARGKTFLAAKLRRYCEWHGYRTKHVETVAVRRRMFGKVEPDSFFNPNSVEMKEHRHKAQEKALDEAIEYLQTKNGQVVIYDATNSTRSRRKWVCDYVAEHLKDASSHDTIVSHRVLFIESFCDDSELIERNFRELRRAEPKFDEYKGISDEQAVAKFHEKLKFYDQEYEALNGEEDLPFLKLVNYGKQLVVNKINGYLESKLVAFCMNIHTEPRVIILVRHGQSEYNLQDRIGGDPCLTEDGTEFAKNLAEYIHKEAPNGLQGGREVRDAKTEPQAAQAPASSSGQDQRQDANTSPYAFDTKKDLHVWTSNLRRTIQTAQFIEARAKVPWAALSEIDAGVCECMTYHDFKTQLATQYMKRQRNKSTWRYPGGESYVDVKKRLEPVIFELERQRKPIMICAHRAVLRCLYSYFMGISIKTAPFLPFPLHTALVLTPTSGGWREDRIPLKPNVGDLGAHEQDVQAAAAKIMKNNAKKRRLAQEAKELEDQKFARRNSMEEA